MNHKPSNAPTTPTTPTPTATPTPTTTPTAAPTTTAPTTATVILGSGIIGLCTAYFLSESGNTDAKSISVIDTSPELFRCASGLAAGFLVQDWFAPSVAPLGTLSFKLHRKLAHAHNGRAAWGYAQSTGISLTQDSEAAVSGSGEDWLENGTSRAQVANHNRPWEGEQKGPEWLRRVKDDTMEVISRDNTTAQIDPLRFCQWLLAKCQERGVHIRHPARATTIVKDARGVLKGIRIFQNDAEIELPCTRLIFTSGAWTPRIFNTLFPTTSSRIPISPLAGHSLLIRNHHAKPEKEICHAIFATDTLGFSPEWFARLDCELYLAGLNSTMIPLPDIATDVIPSPKAVEQLHLCAKAMIITKPDCDVEVLRESLCFRPVTSSGRPIISRIPDDKLGGVKTHGGAQGGVFIAAGHGAWGISQAPGTGLVLADLVEGREPSVKIDALELPC